jgi:murein DD-endopeptidase MepM/ murein hydrolase activator NlpD
MSHGGHPGDPSPPTIRRVAILERMIGANRRVRAVVVVATALVGAACGQYYGVHDAAAERQHLGLASSHHKGSTGVIQPSPDFAGDDGAEGPGPNAITGNSTAAAPRTVASPRGPGGKSRHGNAPGQRKPSGQGKPSGHGSGGPTTGNSRSGGSGSQPGSGTQPVYRVPKSVEAVLRAGASYNSKVLPAGFPFVICPVQGPFSYSDDYGAPRYAGGYHPHAGNDIFSHMETPIVAPFDGYAEKDPNTLGGLAVKISGPLGYVYMAHMIDYAPAVPGPVRAGDVVGFVGNTGDAQGTSPHDHFEWHPKVVHSYDRVVPGTDGAVDPFRYLVIVCPPG